MKCDGNRYECELGGIILNESVVVIRRKEQNIETPGMNDPPSCQFFKRKRPFSVFSYRILFTLKLSRNLTVAVQKRDGLF